MFDQDGNLYGTTQAGGASCSANLEGCGVVFELAPAKRGKWKETVLYAFQGGLDGSPDEAVTLDGKGNIFGVTDAGGQGSGTVFELTP